MQIRNLTLLLAILIGFTASVFYFAVSVNKPYIGVMLEKKGQQWEVSTVDPAGVGRENGIQVGDIPIRINGQPAENFISRFGEHGAIFEYLINSLVVKDASGNEVTASIRNHSPTTGSLTESFSFFIASLIFMGIGLFTWRKRPHHKAAVLLLLISVLFMIAVNSTLSAQRMIRTATQVEDIATVIGPWLLMHFFLILPEEQRSLRSSRYQYLVYLVPIVTLLLLPFFGYDNSQPVPWFRDFRLYVYAAGFVGSIVVVGYNYIHFSSIKTRQQMKIIGLSCLLALVPFLVFSVLPEAVEHRTIVPPETSILFIVFIPLGIAYAIINQKLMDIDLIIRRSLVYGLISAIMALLLAVAIIVAIQFPLRLFDKVLLALVLGITASVLFGPLKHWVETVIDRLFYKDRYDYRQIIKSFSDALNTVNDFTDVARITVGTISHTLNLAGAAVISELEPDSFRITTAQGIFLDGDIQHRLLELTEQQPHWLPESEDGLEAVEYRVPLKIGENKIAILFLSQKASRQVFSADDYFLVEGIANVASMAMRSSLLVQDVSLRNTFVSVASHEMRTPMTTILGYTDLLLKREVSEKKRKEWLSKIYRSGQSINSLVNDLLDVSRIQSGKLEINLQPVNLEPIIENCLTLVQEDDTHEFTVDVNSALPKVMADPDKLEHIIFNLLDNAMKYSPAGGRVTIKAKQDKENQNVVISVSDQGIGIREEDQKKLFKTFGRIRRPETLSIRGNGLGLFIAKEWSEVMGGRISLISKINEGSTFSLTIPVADI